ncbi:hypothetical protein GAR05_06384 [Micromonospora saelicesensis]|uniref:Uncharacterized protein n=1 Tax=Micromonospora saelicesensis TaxID=285676 RepID=A0ABX9C998_9ACTN|nr:hypothetical protein [Micromonospora saelicesensis]RAN92221.1 hypothetical protein GAR05_06384 [Micromonospora saelicesensis]
MRATPPALLDGAHVQMFANLGPGQSPTGAVRHSISNFAEVVAHLAIARYADAGEAYLFYCSQKWEVLTDTWHPTESDAVTQAECEFGPVTFVRVAPESPGDLEA